MSDGPPGDGKTVTEKPGRTLPGLLGIVVAACWAIVEGAVGMVEDALQLLTKNRIGKLDDARKAAMVSNLLVVLTSEQPTSPVIGTGS